MLAKGKLERNCAASKRIMDELVVSGRELNRASADFLKADLATALTFVRIAKQTDEAIKKRRNQRAARKAYDTINKFAKNVDLTRDDAKALSRHLALLKSELRALGETFK